MEPRPFSVDKLHEIMQRVERLSEERDSIGEDIKNVYIEAKSLGFDTKILKQVIKLRKMDKAARDELDEVTALYRSALGL